MHTFTAHSDNAKRQRCSARLHQQALLPQPQLHPTASARQHCLQYAPTLVLSLKHTAWAGASLKAPTPCPPEFLQLLQSIVAQHATQQQAHNAAFVAAVVPALFLIVSVIIAPSSSSSSSFGLRLHVHSDLPVGAGLGSSAAFSVSVAAAALELSALSAAAAGGHPATCRIERALVNEWALQARPACCCCCCCCCIDVLAG